MVGASLTPISGSGEPSYGVLYRKLDYRLRAWGLLLSGYAAGILALVQAGLVGSGRLYLLALPAGAIALVGVHSGLVWRQHSACSSIVGSQ